MINNKYENLPEAFESLPEATRRHCERVASYTRIIFLRATEAEIYPSDQKVVARLREEYAELITNIGLYHDIGKIFVPAELHFPTGLDNAEKSVYDKHIIASFELVNEYFRADFDATANETNFAVESVKSMHENWDGTGFPEGLKGRKIPVIARIMKIADAIDNAVINKHSETPFEDTIAEIETGRDKLYDPEILDLIPSIQGKLKKVYRQGMQYTKTIPAIDSFVKRKPKRPIKLVYRAMVDRNTLKTVAFEAKPRFFINNCKDEKDWSYVEHVFKGDKKLLRELCIYMAEEACDTVRRADSCGLDVGYIALNLPAGWFKTAGAAKDIVSVVSDSEIKPDRLCIVIDEKTLSGPRTNLFKNTLALSVAGIRVMASDVDLTKAPQEDAAENEAQTEKAEESESVILTDKELILNGFGMFRMTVRDEERAENSEYLEMLKNLASRGIEILADNLDDPKTSSSLKYLGVKTVSGAYHGDYLFEDDMIKSELVEEA